MDQIALHVRKEIEGRLSAIEVEKGVRFLLAVESGSRAWGFPSPDSDYDVRFIYVRQRDWYLQLNQGRDVIERPITDEIDLNGWDVRKALGLLLRSNAVVSEWLCSPIRYRPDHPAAAAIAALADAIFDPSRIAQHYASLGREAARWFDGGGPVPVKKYCYALRPALVIRALRCNPDRRPPMNLQALLVESDVPAPIIRRIEDLIEVKRQTRELGTAGRIPELEALIRAELGRAGELPQRRTRGSAVAEADKIFLDLVNS